MTPSVRRSTLVCLVLALALGGALGCSSGEAPPQEDEVAMIGSGETLPNALLLSLAVLGRTDEGKPLPLPARMGILQLVDGEWVYTDYEDEDSNVFHKAMVYEPRDGERAILTAGGTRAVLKLLGEGGPQILWEKDFGGRFSRMRDVEAADLYGDGTRALAVATHDQGVVAIVRPTADGFEVEEIDAQEETFVHEIEIGDLDGDGTLEVYATPSARNKLDGSPQPGSVTRYVPATGEGRVVVAELGDRHAKEILVDDVDGDGTDELYAAIEAVSGGKVEIRRYDAGTDPTGGAVIAEIDDQLTRFLTAGDWDGDGVKEMVAAAHKSGLWLLRPQDDPRAAWSIELIDADSTGFEHAAIFTDLDGDGADELYVASDKHGEVRRYSWADGSWTRETIWTYPGGFSGFTWNIMPAPMELLP
jgi:hypothetical protein